MCSLLVLDGQTTLFCSSFNLMDSKRQTFMDHIFTQSTYSVLHIYSTMNYKFKISVMVDGGVG